MVVKKWRVWRQEKNGKTENLNEAAKRILSKAKYKRGNSTRQLSQRLASKGHVGGKNTIWRFMKSEGWRPLRRQRKPLLTAKQRTARLEFAKQCKNLTVEEWDDFHFSDKCPKYLFQLPNPKKWYCLGFSGEPSTSSISGLKKFKVDHMGRNDRPFFTPRTDFDCRLLYQQHIRERSEACPSP